MISVDLAPPARALAIGAHPDDIEFGCGATLAKWADRGTRITLCICTDGSKGTWDAHADLEELVAIREEEQRAAAAVLGAADVEFLRYIDGELIDDLTARAAVCRVIRRTQPDVVLTHDPWQPYRVHPDHRHAGMLGIGGIVAARDPHFFPDQELAIHRPTALLLFEPGRVDHVEDVDGCVDRKINALLEHRSQWLSTLNISSDLDRATFVARIRAEARSEGLRAGLRAAESFARVDAL